MAKKVEGYIKLQIAAGNATPAPPVGPALGQKGVNIMDFCKQFNARTQDQAGMIIPVVITVYADTSFTFICKTPPARSVPPGHTAAVPHPVFRQRQGALNPRCIPAECSFSFVCPSAHLLQKGAAPKKRPSPIPMKTAGL